MSLLARVLARLRGRTLVGGDENGNLYYKWYETVSKAEAVAGRDFFPSSSSSSSSPDSADGDDTGASPSSRSPSASGLVVERRVVRTPSGSSPQKFDASTIPPEWSAWLRKTRRDPPSPEEAAANAARRERVRSLAAEIDRKRGLLGAPSSSPSSSSSSSFVDRSRGEDRNEESEAAEVVMRSLAEAGGGGKSLDAAFASTPATTTTNPPPSEPGQQQQQQHASISGAEFEAEIWVPPSPPPKKEDEK